MTMTYEIEGTVLVIRQDRENAFSAIDAIFRAALSDPKFKDGSVLLWDATSAPAQAGADQLRTSIARFAKLSDKFLPRCAVLVSNDLQFGVGRMLAAYSDAEGVKVGCFFDFEEAKAWLLDTDESQR